MNRYILDTHVLIWFLEKNLRKTGKIDIRFSLQEIFKKLEESCIDIYFGTVQDLEALDDLEMKIINNKTHGDYIDRMIIATAIANRYTCISADEKFPYYGKNGLKLLAI